MNKDPEIWKTLERYPDYQISNYGRIKSKSRFVRHRNGYKKIKERIMILNKTKTDRTTHIVFRLGNNKVKREKISRLVYENFHGPLISGLVIDHKDNDPLNNYYKNLQQITTRKNNSKDRKNKSSKYTGVFLNKNRYNRGSKKCWVAGITTNRIHKHLGYFETEEKASQDYQLELQKLKENGQYKFSN